MGGDVIEIFGQMSGYLLRIIALYPQNVRDERAPFHDGAESARAIFRARGIDGDHGDVGAGGKVFKAGRTVLDDPRGDRLFDRAAAAIDGKNVLIARIFQSYRI